MFERTQQLQETLRFDCVFNDSLGASPTSGHWENYFDDQTLGLLRDAAGNAVMSGNVLISGTPYMIASNTSVP